MKYNAMHVLINENILVKRNAHDFGADDDLVTFIVDISKFIGVTKIVFFTTDVKDIRNINLIKEISQHSLSASIFNWIGSQENPEKILYQVFPIPVQVNK